MMNEARDACCAASIAFEALESEMYEKRIEMTKLALAHAYHIVKCDPPEQEAVTRAAILSLGQKIIELTASLTKAKENVKATQQTAEKIYNKYMPVENAFHNEKKKLS